jgi:amino acid adenylation domain-containing protein/non-ribosomal peptide synthase protein (TIGR01720 family)
MTAPDLAKRLAELPPEKRAILFQQLQQQKERPAAAPEIPLQSRARESFPLSFAQQRLWFLYNFDPASPEYNIPQAFRIEGDLDPEVMQRSLREVVRRHETLRTTFRSVEGEPVQILAQVVDMEVPFLDVRGRAAAPEGAWAEAMRLAQADAREPFDLALGPLMRSRLFRTGEREHLLYVNVHHIAYDGWSQGIFARELAAIYEAFAHGRPSPLPELPVQYLDFGMWQREWLQGEVLAGHLAWWRRQLASAPPLEMPTDRTRPAVRTHTGDAVPLSLGRPLAGELRRLAKGEGCTLFMVLAAALKALLHHWTTQEDVAVGTLIANRRRPEIEGLIGFFANTLVLRTDLAGDPPFRELLGREREVSLDADAHQDVPFEKLIEELNPPRDLARTPLFQVMLILLNAPGEALELPSLKLRPVPVDSRTSKMEMTLYLTETPNGLDGLIEYNTDLYDRATADRLLGHFRCLLDAVAADPGLRLSELPLLTGEERRRALVEWNATRAERPRATLHGLVEERVRETPDAPAAEHDGEVLSYRALDERANRLARRLLRLGVGTEVLVGVALERSLDMLVGVLAVLKAGGAYVPLDPEYPRERLAYMLEDSRVPVLLTHEKLLDRLPEGPAHVLAVDCDAAIAEIAAESSAPLDGGAEPGNLAYVIYTSGSTGRPKGVQIPHAPVVNFLLSMARRPGLAAGDVLLAVTTLSFDIAGLELYLPLAAGARVVLASRETAQAGEQLAELVERRGITAMQATPATWRLLLGAGWTGRRDLKILCGGEALPRDLASQILGACGSLWNVYGPTEATIWSTLDEVRPEGPVSIGRPLENTQIYLLSRRLDPVPVGVPGELLIGGAGLMRGYRGRPDLTAEKLIPHPFAGLAGEPGARLYRTGDLARYLPDGRLEFLGRIDQQVKVRGFRIELGDIEAALGQHPGVAQAVVTAWEETPGNKKLAAYLVTAPGAEKPEVPGLKAHLKEKLPEYMIPALYTFLDALPLTPNGKVDRRALPPPDKSSAARQYVAPRNDKETFFCGLWQELLGLEKVGADDDFFDLGGDSLLVIRVVTRANKAGMGITTRQVFQHRTVAELSAVAGTTEIVAEQGPVTGPKAFTPAELHFLELRHAHPDYHSIGAFFEPKDGEIRFHLLEAALAHVMRHHDNLRTRLTGEPHAPQLAVDPPGTPVNLLRVDLSALSEDLRMPALRDAVRALVISFGMWEGNLVRTAVFDLEPGKVRYLFLTGHFMAADVGSWQIILDDLDAAYRQLEAGEPVAVPRKTTSSVQWAERLAERAQPGGMPQQERDYWLAQAPLSPPRFPMDHVLGPNDWISARTLALELDVEESTILLQQVPRFHSVQIDALLTTAILSAFESWIGSRSLPILLLGHGREALYDDMDLTRTVGWFNTIYPVLLDMGPNPDLVESARELNRQLRRVPHGGTGFGILRYLSNEPDVAGHLTRALEPQVFFNYFGSDNSEELGRLKKLQSFGGYHQDRTTKRICPITVGGFVIGDKVLMKWEYNLNLHKPETIQPLARRCEEVLRWFVEDFRARNRTAS